jgi:hypothetical protein
VRGERIEVFAASVVFARGRERCLREGEGGVCEREREVFARGRGREEGSCSVDGFREREREVFARGRGPVSASVFARGREKRERAGVGVVVGTIYTNYIY